MTLLLGGYQFKPIPPQKGGNELTEIQVPVAYELDGMTFCPHCALRATVFGMLIGGLPSVSSMDEAIATMTLTQIERGLPIDTPVATVIPAKPKCDSCGNAFPTRDVEEVA